MGGGRWRCLVRACRYQTQNKQGKQELAEVTSRRLWQWQGRSGGKGVARLALDGLGLLHANVSSWSMPIGISLPFIFLPFNERTGAIASRLSYNFFLRDFPSFCVISRIRLPLCYASFLGHAHFVFWLCLTSFLLLLTPPSGAHVCRMCAGPWRETRDLFIWYNMKKKKKKEWSLSPRARRRSRFHDACSRCRTARCVSMYTCAGIAKAPCQLLLCIRIRARI